MAEKTGKPQQPAPLRPCRRCAGVKKDGTPCPNKIRKGKYCTFHNEQQQKRCEQGRSMGQQVIDPEVPGTIKPGTHKIYGKHSIPDLDPNLRIDKPKDVVDLLSRVIVMLCYGKICPKTGSVIVDAANVQLKGLDDEANVGLMNKIEQLKTTIMEVSFERGSAETVQRIEGEAGGGQGIVIDNEPLASGAEEQAGIHTDQSQNDSGPLADGPAEEQSGPAPAPMFATDREVADGGRPSADHGDS